ncbi:TetR/AcrR family transcriptional regulator [Streptomyces thermoviolaceus]|uniref:Helix-turn-helix transcriptional regulator n=1 Tax=Streptomyces thermoviolaceus subsp. thermoviolaceus TaxID=66860 RepID=A0ABX0Z219_STRTL|nr:MULTISPECIES: TetR/AcrR family transcriptional regulator [Streptomyces]MCM3266730.1 TetR/AcrR family transcriptional regulator [Streptomyces thermoviolaceus]NJP17325.1 helix-turn-helix transcriptional regulator [Streptomyces thermoviolaceus subsp. thermoviolaceus]RSR98322.1 TetR/AcrR family transcriptional regulator [Streptomyces sp. WAC00469]WTD50627.1 TetR/AcrR family transcriptional regulator [Streptomyces thermoviolaceus]GHB13510.1 TetR family transcriptional regulator [Streptomyces the
MTPQPFPVSEIVASRRPHRKDAARNFDALLAAARAAFAEHGAEASLEDIARRAGVGIGTLYRNFPTRRDLFESVYADEVNELCQVAEEVAGLEPWEALTAWLDRFTGYTVTKRAVREALDGDAEIFQACRKSMEAAGGPLFERAQQAGQARRDMSFDDLLRMIAGIAATAFDDEDQRRRVLSIALDGVRASR